MSIQSEITRLRGNVSNTLAAIAEMGGMVPASATSDDMADAVRTISGGDLNFEVVGGTIQPANPEENTVWVNTPTAITKWTVSASAPSNPVSGDVWLSIALVSAVSVDVVDENDIILNLSEVKQYDGSTWGAWGAKIYQNGEWLEFDTSIYMIKDGKLILTPSMTTNATFENGDGYVLFHGAGGGYWCGWFADIDIDGDNHSQLIIEGTFVAGGSEAKFYFAIWENTVTPTKDNYSIYKNYSTGTAQYSVDVSSLKGRYHVGLVSTFTQEQKITAMYLAE